MKRTRSGVLTLIAFASLSGCSARPLRGTVSAGPIAVSRPEPNGTFDASAAPAPADAGTGRQADDVVARALAQASRIRELLPTAKVRGVALARRAIGVDVKKTIEREIPPAVLDAEGETLVALGVVPPTFDYMKAIVSLMTAELAGYYEPADKTMYLASDLGPVEREATLSHELVHALQDQHYGLGRLLDYRDDASDEQSALHALAEGDATSAMLDAMLEPRGQKATDLPEGLLALQVRASAEFGAHSGEVPDILKRSLVAPYLDGVTFVHELRRRGGWAEVDRVWKNPPKSTAELLHPEKLAAGILPVVVGIPVAPEGGPNTVLYHDVFGEEALRILFEEWLPRRAAAEAANHWAGDRIAVFRDESRVAVALRVRFDDQGSARRAERAFRRGVAAELAGNRTDSPDPGGSVAASSSSASAKEVVPDCVERRAIGPLAVARRRSDVAVVAGPYVRRDGSVEAAGSCALARTWALRILSAP